MAGRAAPVEEVIRTTANTGFLGEAPVGFEHGVQMIAAIRRLDVCKVCTLRAQLYPVNVSLPA
ncbi:hypothetical protein D3C72_2436260 [compost metagenome]